jgi:hypothetical protein
VELAVRSTHEVETVASGGALAATPVQEAHEDWRARVTLRARRGLDPAWDIDNAYRMEWVEDRTGRPGTVAAWTCALRGAVVEWRVEASAFALRGGQLAYQREEGPVGQAAFWALSGKGAALSTSLQVGIAPEARLGASWARRAGGGARVLVFFVFQG